MIRAAVCAALLALVLGAVNTGRPAVVSDAQRARFAEACGHYRDTAAAEDFAPEDDFEAILVRVCDAARAGLEAGPRRQRVAAGRLLLRIARLEEEVAAMNAARAARGAAPVTATGEYLIAHRIGVISALDVWLDSGTGFSLASHP